MSNQDSAIQQPMQQPPQQEGIADTGSGFLVGVDPAQPRRANEWGQQPEQQQQPQPNGQQQPTFTAEDIERARQQEKDKLYGRIDEMGTQLKSVLEERQAEQAERDRLAQEAAEATRLREEQEMDLRTLLEKRDEEWQSRFQEAEERYQADRAIFEKERLLGEVQEYRRQRMEQEQEYLLPELREFVAGDTPEQIDQSIEFIKERSQQIVSNFAAAAQQQQQPFRGGTAMPSVPPVGPLEQLPSQESLTPDAIAAMDMDTYKKYRPALLQAASHNQRRGR